MAVKPLGLVAVDSVAKQGVADTIIDETTVIAEAFEFIHAIVVMDSAPNIAITIELILNSVNGAAFDAVLFSVSTSALNTVIGPTEGLSGQVFLPGDELQITVSADDAGMIATATIRTRPLM